MNTNTFLTKLQEELEEEKTLTLETEFKKLDSYDSMSVLSIIAFVDEMFDKKLDTKQFKDIQSLQELKDLIGNEHFED